MDENILDQLDSFDNQIHYSNSKKNLKKASGLVLGSIASFMISMKTGFFPEVFSSIGVLLFIIAVVTSFSGFRNGLKSYSKKEKHSANRFLILIGNFIIFGVFVLMMVWNVIDLFRFFNS